MTTIRSGRHRRITAVGALAAVTGLILAACGAGGDPVGSSIAPTSTMTPEAAPATALTYESEAQGAWIRVIVEHPDAVRPDVPFVRAVDAEEQMTVLAECLRGEGFEVEENGGGGIGTSVPVGDEERFAIARYACTVRFPLDLSYLTPLTVEQLARLHEHYVGDDAACVATFGLTAPTPPPLEEFIDTYGTARWWDPRQALVEAGVPVPAGLIEACPWIPMDLF